MRIPGVIAGAPKLLLDRFPSAAAAYSLRRLRRNYNGAAIRVRRSNDNAESDIGFTSSGDLDTATLKTFVGANNGFVVTWYDQSGNSRNATQSTAANQPDIAVAGVIRRDINNLPTINFNGASNRFNVDTLLSDQFEGVNQTLSVFSVNRPSLVDQRRAILTFAGNELTGTSNDRMQFGIANDLTEGLFVIRTTVNTNKIITSSPNTIGINTNKILSWIKTSGNGTVYVNNNAGTAASQTNEALTLRHATIGASIRGSDNAIADYYAGRMPEVIIWNTDQTSNRTGIMTNINTYYAIY